MVVGGIILIACGVLHALWAAELRFQAARTALVRAHMAALPHAAEVVVMRPRLQGLRATLRTARTCTGTRRRRR